MSERERQSERERETDRVRERDRGRERVKCPLDSLNNCNILLSRLK